MSKAEYFERSLSSVGVSILAANLADTKLRLNYLPLLLPCHWLFDCILDISVARLIAIIVFFFE